MKESIKAFPSVPYRSAEILSANRDCVLFSTIEDDGSKTLRKYVRADNSIEAISRHTAESYFLASKSQDKVYFLEATDGRLVFNDNLGGSVCFPIVESEEAIIDETSQNDFFFVKTAVDNADCEQTQRLYLIDLRNRTIVSISDEMITNSYRMPHLVLSSQGYKVLVEEAVVFPYELSELNNSSNEHHFSNRFFLADLDDLIVSEASQCAVLFSEIDIPEYENCYNQVLNVVGDYAYIACINPIEQSTRVFMVNIVNNAVENEIQIPSLIDSALTSEDGSLLLYRWGNSELTFFNLNGEKVLRVNLNGFDSKNRSLELNYILSYIEKLGVVFHGTEYIADDERQIRVVYDIGEETFIPVYSSFITWNETIY